MDSIIPRTFYRLGVIICVFAIAPFMTQAQQKVLWEAAVTPSELNVYTDASTTTQVAMVLKQNYWVNVILEVNSSGIDWCRIEMPGEAEPAGYVFCKELQQRSAPQKATMNPDSNEGSPRRNEVAAIASPSNSTEKAPITCESANKRRYSQHEQNWSSIECAHRKNQIERLQLRYFSRHSCRN